MVFVRPAPIRSSPARALPGTVADGGALRSEPAAHLSTTVELPSRWPSLRAVAGCAAAAAIAVGVDAYFSAQDGYLARPLEYDGVSYVTTAQSVVALIRSLHPKAALHELVTTVSPLWVGVLTTHQLVLGAGPWQAFSARFWPVALLLLLVYWSVSRRSTSWLGVVAVALTALLPAISPGVRASSVEFFTGQSNYIEHWYLVDLRPDFFTIVMILWSVAALVEFGRMPRRSAYVVSALFAAAAVLAKSSTAPVALAIWAAALCYSWLWRGRSGEATRMSIVAAIVLVVILAPYLVFAHGLATVVTYLQQVNAFRGTYTSSGGVIGGFTYFPARIPFELGPVEAWIVIVGAAFVAAALVRRKLGAAEVPYAGLAFLSYVAFSLPPSKNPILGMWITLPLWLFTLTGAGRLASAPLRRRAPVTLSAAGAYVLAVYVLGIVSLAGWPANEQRSDAQLLTVTAGVAQELGRHVSSGQCFQYAPGPGWPATLLQPLMDSEGNGPVPTAIDVDPTRTTVDQYVAAAANCSAALVYEQDITEVAQVFFAPSTRQPYLRAVAAWVRDPQSGFKLDRSWNLVDLAPSAPHALGRYRGISLTVDLYLKG